MVGGEFARQRLGRERVLTDFVVAHTRIGLQRGAERQLRSESMVHEGHRFGSGIFCHALGRTVTSEDARQLYFFYGTQMQGNWCALTNSATGSARRDAVKRWISGAHLWPGECDNLPQRQLQDWSKHGGNNPGSG